MGSDCIVSTPKLTVQRELWFPDPRGTYSRRLLGHVCVHQMRLPPPPCPLLHPGCHTAGISDFGPPELRTECPLGLSFALLWSN